MGVLAALRLLFDRRLFPNAHIRISPAEWSNRGHAYKVNSAPVSTGKLKILAYSSG
jgi:hypothetical protein